MNRVLTDKQRVYINNHYLIYSSREIAIALSVARSTIRSYLRYNELTVPSEIAKLFKIRAQTGKTTSTPKIDKYLKKHYLDKDYHELGRCIDKSTCFVKKRLKQLGLIVPPEIIATRKSRFEKGHVPMNKGMKITEYASAEAIERMSATQFKKGQLPHNTRAEGNGALSIRYHKESNLHYYYIRVSVGKWRQWHQVIWEQDHGPIPEGHIVIFKDKNQKNVAPDNLELITQEENMARNTIHRYPIELKQTIRTLNKLNQKIYEKQDRRPA